MRVYTIAFLDDETDLKTMEEELGADLDELGDDEIIAYLKPWQKDRLRDHDVSFHAAAELEKGRLGYVVTKEDLKKGQGLLFFRDDDTGCLGLFIFVMSDAERHLRTDH